MKTFKKTILVFAMTMVMGASAFAASGFEFILNVPFSFNLALSNSKLDNTGGNIGVSAQLGYMWQVQEGFGLSVLGELGYSLDTYDMGEFVYNSVQVGLLPKFNLGFGGRHGLAIGIGGGVKIPMSMKYTEWVTTTTTEGNLYTTSEGERKLGRKEISDAYYPDVIGYIKASIDYYLFFTDKIAMELGLYLGGDIRMASRYVEPRTKYSAFNIGLQLGFRFGPKA